MGGSERAVRDPTLGKFGIWRGWFFGVVTIDHGTPPNLKLTLLFYCAIKR